VLRSLCVWGCGVALGEGVLCAAGVTPAAWVLLHLLVAFGTYRLWRVLGAAPLVAARAGLLALALPVVGAWVACLFNGRVGAATPTSLGPDEAFMPLLGPNEAPELPPPVGGLWELLPDLLEGNLETRLQAIKSLQGVEPTDAVRALRWTLASPDHQASLLASLALSRMETDFEERIRDARQALAVTSDPVSQARARRALAEVLQAYAQSGLVAEAALRPLWLAVAEHAEAGLGTNAQGSCTLLLARAKLALGEPQQALEALEALLADDPDHQEAALLRLEALFARGSLEKLRTAATALLPHTPVGTAAHAIVSHWSLSHVSFATAAH
jgi:tetratricopeptide (TPR) repeat protein